MMINDLELHPGCTCIRGNGGLGDMNDGLLMHDGVVASFPTRRLAHGFNVVSALKQVSSRERKASKIRVADGNHDSRWTGHACSLDVRIVKDGSENYTCVSGWGLAHRENVVRAGVWWPWPWPCMR